MSRIAQKEDLSDADVIADFARLVGTPERLTALYLLTVADIRGTSPKVWNAWKGKLLEDLYRLTLRALGGARPNLDAEIEARKQEARQNLALHSALPGTEEPLWKTLEVSYFARHDAADIAWHARSLWRHLDTRVPVVRARALVGGRRPAGAGLLARPARPVRAHLRLLRQRRLQHPGRQDPHHARRLRAGHLPGREHAAGCRQPGRPRGPVPRPDLAGGNAGRQALSSRRPAARAQPRPRVAPRAQSFPVTPRVSLRPTSAPSAGCSASAPATAPACSTPSPACWRATTSTCNWPRSARWASGSRTPSSSTARHCSRSRAQLRIESEMLDAVAAPAG